MSDTAATQDSVPEEIDPASIGHPRGTLVIVLLYALLFGLGWLALYLFRFLGQGAPHGH